MKKISLLFALCFLVLVLPATYASLWLPNFEDVPQMERTFVVEDGGFLFSVMDGKIAQTTVASTEVSRRDFMRFYDSVLNQLGWRRIYNSRIQQTFIRGSEQLIIEIISEEPLEASFKLSPR
ncbi:MAG: hypothetical protein FWC83_02365 [Alphaproteobacteria bacterium]|nr:hypothetical protein [Alphaproteobacteria bacterium]